MKEEKLLSQIKNAIDNAQGMQSYEQVRALTFSVVDRVKILHGTYNMYLVRFETKNHANAFADSLAKILPSATVIQTIIHDDGTAEVTFDP
jgi:hypothetical protein